MVVAQCVNVIVLTVILILVIVILSDNSCMILNLIDQTRFELILSYSLTLNTVISF